MKRRLLDRIAAEGPLPFDEYMQMCLYDESEGFFSAGRVRPGTVGDFVTSPEVSSWFGSAIGRWAAERVSADGVVAEIGAGSGALLEGVAREVAGTGNAVFAVELSASARTTIADRVPTATLVGSLGDVPATDGSVVIANEVFDNMPARLVSRRDGAWQERVVSSDGDELVWSEPVADDVLAEWCDTYLAAAVDGAVYAAQIDMTDWIAKTLSRSLCSLLAIDYAADTKTLGARLAPQVVRTFRSHREGSDPLAAPGEADLTVEVNSDVVARATALAGATLTTSTQAEFLERLGASDALAALENSGFESARSGDVMAQLGAKSDATNLRALLDPTGLGGFTVFEIQSGT
ncbi:MAG: SAM-dependent methyltransferase [Acidimicrobiia bacterium]